MGYMIEEPNHFTEMNPVLFLFDFLFTHHFDFKSGSNVSLPRFYFFNFMDLPVN